MLIPQFNQSSDRLYAAAIAGDLATEKQSLQEANGAANAINLAIAETCRMREEAAKQSHVEAETTFKKLRAATVSLATAVLLAGIGCGIFTIRLVTRPLRAMMEVLAAAANGDLTKRLSADTHDELGRMAAALNEALESTRMALIEVNVTASALSGASRDLTEAASMLESGSRDQARELESTTAQLGEIGRTATQTAGNATRATLLASGSNGHGEGASSAENAVAAMAEINVASSKIAGIIGVVDVIAFQTGLLSLNASVEAAHAGEGGRGFAVVAQEVRNLAQRSAGSATEIKSLIEDSKVKVGRGSALVDRITRLIEQIASASEEQRAGIGLVNGAMVNMDRITKGNSVQAASLAATAKSLASQAFHLQEMIARFELQERPLDWAS